MTILSPAEIRSEIQKFTSYVNSNSSAQTALMNESRVSEICFITRLCRLPFFQLTNLEQGEQ